MIYYKDPVFKNLIKDSRYSKCIFGAPGKVSLRTGQKDCLVLSWSDGIPFKELDLIKKRNQVLLTNNIILDSDQYRNNIHTVNESYYGAMYHGYQVDPLTKVKKLFNCFSNRFDIVRQSWFYHLIRRNWLDQGYVSFNCDINRGRRPDPSYDPLTPWEIFEKSFVENNQNFLNEHNQIKGRIEMPYCNFDDPGDLTDLILSSKFSIILETWFHDNRVITFTEKIIRNLQLPRPWVLFTTQFGVRQLRLWGFDVLDDIVEHDRYDQIDNPIQRQVAILDLANELVNLDIEQIANRCLEASLHNQSILKRWNESWFINMEKDLETTIQKVRTLNHENNKTTSR